MADAELYYERALFFLGLQPPNIAKALALLHRAARLYVAANRVNDYEKVIKRITEIYLNLYENTVRKAERFIRVGLYADALDSFIKAYRYLLKIDSDDRDRKIRNLRKKAAPALTALLGDITKRTTESPILTEELCSDFGAVMDIIGKLYPDSIPNNSDRGSMAASIIINLQNESFTDMFIKAAVAIGEKALVTADAAINAGDIRKAEKFITFAEKIFEAVGSDRYDTVLRKKAVSILYNLKGDKEYTAAYSAASAGRLLKALAHLRQAELYYKKAGTGDGLNKITTLRRRINIGLAEENFEKAVTAAELGDVKSATDLLDKAELIASGTGDKKLSAKIRNMRKKIFRILGENALKNATDPPEKKKVKEKSPNPDLELRLIAINYLNDAVYYFNRAGLPQKADKAKRKIGKLYAETASFYRSTGDYFLKKKDYISAFVFYRKAADFYDMAGKKGEAKSLRNKLAGLRKKLIDKLGHDAERIISEKEAEIAESQLYSEPVPPPATSNKTSDTFDAGLFDPEFLDKQFLCKKCGRWVRGYFYDAVQETCLECRENIVCDECGKTIGPNEVYTECRKCGNRFCLECSDGLYDFNEKLCKVCAAVEETGDA